MKRPQTRPLRSLQPMLLAVAIGLGPTAMAGPAALPAASAVEGTLLSVSSTGEAERTPDIAVLSAGVVTRAADANAAMQSNASRMDEVMKALRDAGIAARDIQTSGVNLFPQYRHDDETPVITGYQASNTVDVTVRDIGGLGDVMGALVASGANQINGPTFDIDDRTDALDEARMKAVANARTRAALYAETLGLRVRRIVSLDEGGGLSGPMPMMGMARVEKATAPPISPGQSSVSVTLDVVFELGE